MAEQRLPAIAELRKTEIRQSPDLSLLVRASAIVPRGIDQPFCAVEFFLALLILAALDCADPIVPHPSIFSETRGSLSYLRTVPARNRAQKMLLPACFLDQNIQARLPGNVKQDQEVVSCLEPGLISGRKRLGFISNSCGLLCGLRP